jgi:hypothetical protein
MIVPMLWSALLAAPPQQTAAQSVPQTPVSTARVPTDFRPVIARYCVNCHSERVKAGGLVLENLDLANVPAHGDVWEKVVRKLRGGMMPPQGMPRPDPPTVDGLVASLETTLDRAAAANPNPGRPLLHRVNRAEYANAIRDLLALDVDPSALLPADDSSSGFDNVADVLGVSSVLIERYLSAAMKISALAVGDVHLTTAEETYRSRADSRQMQHVEGLGLGTRGGLLIRHTFPVDAEYIIKPTLWRNNVGRLRGTQDPHQLEISVDGERVHLVTVGTPEEHVRTFDDRRNAESIEPFDKSLSVRVPIKAGPRVIGVTFVDKTAAEEPLRLRPLLNQADGTDTYGVPKVDTVTIAGPYNITGPGDTPSRHRIFACRPAATGSDEPCVQRIVSALARHAYRRPVTDSDIQLLLEFYRSGRSEGGFEAGVQHALARILASPEFVFRVESEPPGAAPGTVHRISDLELASRLSFFLWSSVPDEQLLQVAAEGQLKTPAVLEQQARRLLADPKSQALVDNFAAQWLYLRNLRNADPNFDDFPDFDDDLRQAMRRETELLFESVVRENRSVLDLLNADYTFVNERLARHYKIPKVYGSQFRRVPVLDEARKGLLGQGSVLTVTSNANRTSPVRRGKWILENLLGTPPPSPPNNVPPLKENAERDVPLSMRAQMEEHRTNPACAGCHKLMDPLGFALENFNAVGAWRTKDSGLPVDASVELADGTKVDGPVALRRWLVRRPESFARVVTEKLLTYALGRGLTWSDMPAVRAIVRDAARQNYRFSALMSGITKSVPFQMRAVPPSERETPSVKAN